MSDLGSRAQVHCEKSLPRYRSRSRNSHSCNKGLANYDFPKPCLTLFGAAFTVHLVTFSEIQAARQRLGRLIYQTSCPLSHTLSRLCDCNTYCKFENLQMTGSFFRCLEANDPELR